MTLDDWLKNKWLKKERAGAGEISSLMKLAQRYLRDASVDIISPDARIQFAFNAVLTSATIAIRALGFRIPPTEGHHEKTINSLKYTIGAPSLLITKLNGLRKKRINITYDSVGTTSDKEVAESITQATELFEQIMKWISKNYPDLYRQ